MIYHAPTGHIGHYDFPDDCKWARAYYCPDLTSVTFPNGCTSARVENCPGLTSLTFPEGCTGVEVSDCPALTHINGVRVNSDAEAEPYLREVAKHALQDRRLNMELVRMDTDCGTVACIAGWAGVLFPDRIRPGRELVDAIAVLGLEAASMFFKTTPEGRDFLEQFVESKP